MRTCSVTNCKEPHLAKNLCYKHYWKEYAISRKERRSKYNAWWILDAKKKAVCATGCGKPAAFGKTLCIECNKENTERTKQRQRELSGKGLCRTCGKPSRPRKKTCQNCFERQRELYVEKMNRTHPKEITKPSGVFIQSGAPDGRVDKFLVEEKRRSDKLKKNQIAWHEWFHDTFGVWVLIHYVDFEGKSHWFENYRDFIEFTRKNTL